MPRVVAGEERLQLRGARAHLGPRGPFPNTFDKGAASRAAAPRGTFVYGVNVAGLCFQRCEVQICIGGGPIHTVWGGRSAPGRPRLLESGPLAAAEGGPQHGQLAGDGGVRGRGVGRQLLQRRDEGADGQQPRLAVAVEQHVQLPGREAAAAGHGGFDPHRGKERSDLPSHSQYFLKQNTTPSMLHPLHETWAFCNISHVRASAFNYFHE